MLQRSGCCKKKNKLKPIEFYNIVPTLNLRLSRQIDENDRKGEEPVEKRATHLVLPHVLLFGHKKSEKKSLPFIADLLVISRQAKRGPPIFFFFFAFLRVRGGAGSVKQRRCRMRFHSAGINPDLSDDLCSEENMTSGRDEIDVFFFVLKICFVMLLLFFSTKFYENYIFFNSFNFEISFENYLKNSQNIISTWGNFN